MVNINNIIINNNMSVDISASTAFCSFDGNHIVSTRLDGSLFIQFNDDKRHGVGYFSDPYKKNPKDISSEAIGFKSVAVNKNHIILTKGYDDMYLGTFELYKDIDEKVDEPVSLNDPELNWVCKINPFKKQNEIYIRIIFLNDEYVFFITGIDNTEFKDYLFNIKTNEWIDITAIKESDDNWVNCEKMFYINCSIDTNNVLIIFLNDGQIKKKFITIKDVKNLGVSRGTKLFSKFDNVNNKLNVIGYQQIYDNNFDYTNYPIKFIDEKEFYTSHNITEKAFIVTTNKNIYVKFFEDDKEMDWHNVELENSSSDTYIINNEADEFIDSTSIFWNGIIVKDNTCILTTLSGDTYILYNIIKNNIQITKSQLPKIFSNDELFNFTFGKYSFIDRFNNKYKIQYFKSKNK